MNEWVSVFNDGDSPRYLGGICIPPGEFGQVPAHLVPATLAEPQPEIPADPLQATLALSVPEIVARFETLQPIDLVRLNDLEEQAEKPRKSLLEAIARELLVRGSAAQADTPE
jgi:hypothetical protein